MQWWGLRSSAAEEVIEKDLPCFENIVGTTGRRVASASKIVNPCGKSRYCLNCETLFKELDTTYPSYVMADVVLALLTKTVSTWTTKDTITGSDWARNETVDRNHACNELCAVQK